MIMRAEEECLPLAEIRVLLESLQHDCDALDCQGITKVLSSAVSGFGNGHVRYDHLWLKKEQLLASEVVPASNVKELFPDKP